MRVMEQTFNMNMETICMDVGADCVAWMWVRTVWHGCGCGLCGMDVGADSVHMDVITVKILNI